MAKSTVKLQSSVRATGKKTLPSAAQSAQANEKTRSLPAHSKSSPGNPLSVEVPDGHLAVGLVVGVHGLRGEVKVELYTDFPERFEPESVVMVGEELHQLLIEDARPHKTHMLLTFKGVKNREQAELLRGKWLFIAEEDAAELEEDEFWVHDILGLQVQTSAGLLLGEISDVLHTGANDVYVVTLDPPRANQKELLLPAIEQVVQQVDLARELMIVSLLPGMLDE